MRCPFCGADDTRVVDSRLANDGDQVRRRRRCVACDERFTTYEVAELTMPRVIKSNDAREPFNDDKLRGGIMRALEKRPVTIEEIEAALSHIRKKILISGEREVPSSMIGELVMDELRGLDEVAYVRFASVYRRFDDIDEFRNMIERLESDPSPEQRSRQIDLLPRRSPKA
ncbi:MAG TPA: transcriptional regulator NrdR [Candidatus Thiothrix moscowensis]|uniref:transcriptional regulator NrdR n=1 Tax=unclassified Thiothrix TaxID=2636184 RepID=UPI001A25032C|nr:MULTISPECIES: transcriptional regulator NrdR [unclassified Thiothrix]MBJ6610454.1 transcriptional regulator NrdR [Candidatus Thiothrix moscowensis]HRJ52456.1 transcriptional regulator NrdR [Candidatus Thiothrix moscowensis]HRJ93358.1 transcriptional regulator NrdR [Candidatus Thiothrix moscowensis]